jgi:hypothetical protein
MQVDPNAIRRFAGTLGLSGEHASAARDYVSRYGNLSFQDEGLLSTARFVHGDFVSTLTGTLDHLNNLLHSAQAELAKAADYYAQADAAAVTRADASYPDSPRSMLSPS